jgi:hypothetical protein
LRSGEPNARGGLVKEYEELSGGLGPTVAYRAQRHLVRELVRDNAARLSVHGVGYPLDDLTMSGVSFLLPPDHNPGAVNDVVGIDIRLHDLVLYRGRARIVREDRSFERCRVALQLLDGFLDLHAMQRADQDRWFDLDPRRR